MKRKIIHIQYSNFTRIKQTRKSIIEFFIYWKRNSISNGILFSCESQVYNYLYIFII